MKLTARTSTSDWDRNLETEVWRVGSPDEPDGHLLTIWSSEDASPVQSLQRPHLSSSPTYVTGRSGPLIRLPAALAHISSGDIVSIAPDGRRVTVLWKSTATHNSLLLTEQCDNLCLMCSQPPRTPDDAWLFDRAKRIVDLLPDRPLALGLTGGEPTLNEEALLGLLRHCADVRPALSLHLLSNGRRFAVPRFASQFAEIPLRDVMVGIPLYAPEPALHDYIVQSGGAFAETVRGILNLAALKCHVEIRIVVQKHTAPVLVALAEFISRNLPFVSQVALMGLEMTGLALSNSADVWIDPAEYYGELREAALMLQQSGIPTKIYNHQLCVIHRDVWPLSVRSISDWKNDYVECCSSCSVQDRCGGVFTTGHGRVSRHLAPIGGPPPPQ